MTPERNTEHIHMKLPLQMKRDLKARARKLGVSEARVVRDALKAQGYGVRWTEPPAAAISPERPAAYDRGSSLPPRIGEVVNSTGVPIPIWSEPVPNIDLGNALVAERQRVLRAQMQPEA